jgi:hypothetical protein
MKNRINGMLWRIELNMALVFLGIGRWRVEPNDLSLRLQRFVIASAAISSMILLNVIRLLRRTSSQ